MPADHTSDPLFLSFQLALAGRFSIEREIGRGGMGVVYLARDVHLDRPVAIKLLPLARAHNRTLRDRFIREARLAAQLSHPNIIPIHSVEELGEYVFYVMAFIDGETLADRIAHRGPLPATEGTRVLRDVALALSHAHEQGVVHRDVKPDNILLERATGRVLVADFGIAAAAQGTAGDVTGTPAFMSPEQALGHELDGRSDVYALGVTAFYALSGRLPFEARSSNEFLAKHITQPAPPLASMGSAAPRRVAALVDHCLTKDRDQRPQTARLVAERLTMALEQRREVPAALQAFVRDDGRLGGRGALLSQLGLLGAGVAVASVVGATAGYATIAAGYVLGPVAFVVRSARRLVNSGFRQRDLPAAFQAEADLAREERAIDRVAHAGLDLDLRSLDVSAVTRGIALTGAALLGISDALSTHWLRAFIPSFRGTWWVFGVAEIALLTSIAAGVAIVGSGMARLTWIDLDATSYGGPDHPDRRLARFLGRAASTLTRFGSVAATSSSAVRLLLAGLLLATGWKSYHLSAVLGISSLSLTAVVGLSSVVARATSALKAVRLPNGPDSETEFWAKLWNGPIGAWAFRQAERFAPRTALQPAMTNRPTELSLSLAVESLYATLPRALRVNLSDVPISIQRLQADAERMRQVVEDLDDALGMATDDHLPAYLELRERRDHVQSELRDVVAAMETIRLNLLRLHAGVRPRSGHGFSSDPLPTPA